MRFPFHQALYAAGATLALGVVGYGGHAAWARLNPPRTIAGEPRPGCDLQREPCRARFAGGGELIVRLTPRPVRLVEPITVDIEVLNLPAESVEIALDGPGVSSAFSRRTLQAHDAQRFRGQTVLAVCSRKRTRWQLQVVARGGRAVHEAAFVFEAAAHTGPAPG
jgi:hypothetical protein